MLPGSDSGTFLHLTTMSNFLFLEIAMLTHKFSSVTLYRNKTVRYAARMYAIMACQMEFQLYPMDIQICPIYIESCKYIHQFVKVNLISVFFLSFLSLLQQSEGALKMDRVWGYP